MKNCFKRTKRISNKNSTILLIAIFVTLLLFIASMAFLIYFHVNFECNEKEDGISNNNSSQNLLLNEKNGTKTKSFWFSSTYWCMFFIQSLKVSSGSKNIEIFFRLLTS